MLKLMVKQRTYSKYAQEAALLLGKQIKLGRKQRKWSEKNLADRIGISRATLQKIENGEMTCAIGLRSGSTNLNKPLSGKSATNNAFKLA